MGYAKAYIRQTAYANKEEAEYAQILDLEHKTGHNKGWWYACVNLKIGESNVEFGKKKRTNSAWTKHDFMVHANDGILEIHEYKGQRRQAGMQRLKTAAMLYPFRFVLVTKQGKNFKRDIV